jgi:sulfide dehydrogenase cytochrome subunit
MHLALLGIFVKHLFPLLVALWAALPVRAQTVETPALGAVCDDCHGPGGVSVHGDVPSIAGKEHVLLERALKQFRNMDRRCQRGAYRHGDPARPPTDMCRVTADLDDAQIEALSKHYAALPFSSAPQGFDPELAVQGAALHSLYCESCHPQGGSEAGYAGRLAGQWTPYLRRMIEEIQKSELIVPHMMERKMSDFSAAEREALLNYWASQQE